MPLVRLKDLRGMSSEDRTKKRDELRTELVRLNTMIGAGGTIENPARVKTLRKAIAKILTVEHEQTHGMRRTETKEKETKKTETRKAEAKKTEMKKTEKKKKEAKTATERTETKKPQTGKRKEK
jgi:large subunit ribosomal protein L29